MLPPSTTMSSKAGPVCVGTDSSASARNLPPSRFGMTMENRTITLPLNHFTLKGHAEILVQKLGSGQGLDL